MHISMLSWNSGTNNSHNILPKPLAAFPNDNPQDNDQL